MYIYNNSYNQFQNLGFEIITCEKYYIYGFKTFVILQNKLRHFTN